MSEGQEPTINRRKVLAVGAGIAASVTDALARPVPPDKPARFEPLGPSQVSSPMIPSLGELQSSEDMKKVAQTFITEVESWLQEGGAQHIKPLPEAFSPLKFFLHEFTRCFSQFAQATYGFRGQVQEVNALEEFALAYAMRLVSPKQKRVGEVIEQVLMGRLLRDIYEQQYKPKPIEFKRRLAD